MIVKFVQRAVRPWAKDPRVLGAAIGLVALGTAGAISAARSRADEIEAVRATASAVWTADLDGGAVTVTAGDEVARQALQRWSLLTPPHRLA